MTRISPFIVILLVCTAVFPVQAQEVQSQVTASNGVIVKVITDGFSNRKEFYGPTIRFEKPGSSNPSYAALNIVRESGANGPLNVSAQIMYGGSWRNYSSAVFKGGAPANFTQGKRDVLGCSDGYCTHAENFFVDITQTDIAKHTENGMLAVQIRPSENGEPVIIPIPKTQIDAVLEVANPAANGRK